MNRTCLIIVAVIAVAAIITGVAHLPVDNTLQRLELQSEARTCWEAKETLQQLDMPRRVIAYCDDIIERYSEMVKVYKKEELQELLKRAQEKG